MEARGKPHPVLQREPILSPHLEPLFSAYHEIGVDQAGRKSLTDMLAMLNELGITDRHERRLVRSAWFEMNAIDIESEEKKNKPRDSEDSDDAEEAESSRRPAARGRQSRRPPPRGRRET